MAKVFLSYNSNDAELAEIVSNKLEELSNEKLKVSRYELLEYRSSIGEFMRSIRDYDYVFSIVTDDYLRSLGCMYEINRIIDQDDFARKMFWCVPDKNDSKYYTNPSDLHVADVYNGIDSLAKYIKYWKAEVAYKKEVVEDIGDIIASSSMLDEIKKAQHILEFDIEKFIRFISDGIGVSFDEMNSSGFRMVFRQMLPEWNMDMFSECKTYKELFVNALNEIVKVTKNDYTQIILSARADSYYSTRVVFADKISTHKYSYKIVNKNGLIERCFVEKKMINIKNVEKEEDYLCAEKTTKSELLIPIKYKENMLGVINSESEYIDYYTDAICNQLEVVANRLGTALHRLGYSEMTHSTMVEYVHQ